MAKRGFWEWVSQPAADACWEWQGPLTTYGYGVYWVSAKRGSEKRTAAHRYAYTLAVGPVSAGLDVCHRCDNRRCCNPAHLFIGTRADNMDDARRKGRVRHGERHSNAKLTDADVAVIRASTETGRALARRFGIGEAQVSRVRRGLQRNTRERVST